MRCTNCGRTISIDETVCPFCDHKIREETLEKVLPFFRRPKEKPPAPMSPFKRIFNVYINPAKAYWDYSQIPDRAGPFLVVLANVLLISLYYFVFFLHIPITEPDIGYIGLLALTIAFFGVFLFNLVITSILLATQAFLYNIGSRIAGGISNFRGVLAVTAYALVPLIPIRILIALILLVLGPLSPVSLSIISNPSQYIVNYFTHPTWIFIQNLELVGFIWIALLVAIGIREKHQISISRSIIVSMVGTVIFLYFTRLGGLVLPS